MRPDPALAKHLEQAAACEADDDLVGALHAYRAALTLDPACVAALVGVGRSNLLLGHDDRAVEDFTRALLLQRDSAEAYLGRGQAFLDLGLYERASADLEAAARLAPDSVDVQLARGQLAAAEEAWPAALEALREAQRLAGGQDADVAIELAMTLLATLEEDEEASAAVLTELREALQLASQGLGPDDPLLAVACAGLEAARGRPEHARPLLAAALAHEPDLADRIENIGVLARVLAGRGRGGGGGRGCT